MDPGDDGRLALRVHDAHSMIPAVPSRRALALTFGALLTLYSVSWMYLVRQESDVVVGIEPEFRPICQCLAITGVTPEGPAARAGVQVGDRVRALDGRPLDRYEPFLDLRRHGRAGQVVRLVVERDGVIREVPVTLMARRDLPATPQAAAWANPGALMRLVQQVLALYPIPFLIVTLVVLLQRPEDPHAWLLALMLGGFIAGAGIEEFEYRVPLPIRGLLARVLDVAWRAAGRAHVRLLRGVPRPRAPRPTPALAQDGRPRPGLRRRRSPGRRRAGGAGQLLPLLARGAVRAVDASPRHRHLDLQRRLLPARGRVARRRTRLGPSMCAARPASSCSAWSSGRRRSSCCSRWWAPPGRDPTICRHGSGSPRSCCFSRFRCPWDTRSSSTARWRSRSCCAGAPAI